MRETKKIGYGNPKKGQNHHLWTWTVDTKSLGLSNFTITLQILVLESSFDSPQCPLSHVFANAGVKAIFWRAQFRSK